MRSHWPTRCSVRQAFYTLMLVTVASFLMGSYLVYQGKSPATLIRWDSNGPQLLVRTSRKKEDVRSHGSSYRGYQKGLVGGPERHNSRKAKHSTSSYMKQVKTTPNKDFERKEDENVTHTDKELKQFDEPEVEFGSRKEKAGRGDQGDKRKRDGGEEGMSNGKKRKHMEGKEIMSHIIDLMGKDGANPTLKQKVDPLLLDVQIQLLVKEMTSDSSMLDEPSQKPHCMGDTLDTEIEDILCIPKPDYLPITKNPCWYATSLNTSGYLDSEPPQLNCLPYFHILGTPKSGTTDMWNRLMYHPQVVSNDGLYHKEALWWAWKRYGISGYKRTYPKTFKSYIRMFKDVSRQVLNSIERETSYHKFLITGDASPPDFWDFRGWRNISQNRGLANPQVITPHLMKHIYENPKFILLFRDPVDRLYSDYFFIGLGLTPLDFHNDILASIDMLSSCVKLLGLTRCFFDPKLYTKLPVRLSFA